MSAGPGPDFIPASSIELLHEVTGFRSGLLGGVESKDMCFVVAAALEGYLNFIGYPCELIKGEIGHSNHFWLALPDGTIIDPTADQFPKPDGQSMPEVYIGSLPEWYRCDSP